MAPKPGLKVKAGGKGVKQPGAGIKPNDNAKAELPPWPPLRPVMPASDLQLETILDGQITVIRKLFTTSLCVQYVSFLKSLPLATTPGQPKKGEALRVNDRFQVEDPAFARQLWTLTALSELISGSDADWGGQVIGLNPRIRIYRYRPGQFFDQHYDESNVITLPDEPDESAIPAMTTWTLLLYLTDVHTGCIGGETVFYPEYWQVKDAHRKPSRKVNPISVAPEAGMALLHKHGQECLLHEGRAVESGEKWIIRSDLCVRR